jgi:hypothetical protein
MEKFTIEIAPYVQDSYDCMVSEHRNGELVVQYQFKAHLINGNVEFDLDPEYPYNPSERYLSFISSTILIR